MRLRSMNWPILAAERAQHREVIVVGLADLAAEEGHDADDVGPVAQGDRESPAQVDLAPKRGERQVRLLGHVGDPERQVAVPHATGQADVARELRDAPELQVVGGLEVVGVPEVHAAQESLAFLDLPQLAHVPDPGSRP